MNHPTVARIAGPAKSGKVSRVVAENEVRANGETVDGKRKATATRAHMASLMRASIEPSAGIKRTMVRRAATAGAASMGVKARGDRAATRSASPVGAPEAGNSVEANTGT